MLIWPLTTARFDLRAAEVQAHLLDEQALDLVDELGALIIEDILVIERQDLLVLGIAAGWGRWRESICTAWLGVFSDGMRLMHCFWRHSVVLLGLLQQLEGLAGQVARESRRDPSPPGDTAADARTAAR